MFFCNVALPYIWLDLSTPCGQPSATVCFVIIQGLYGVIQGLYRGYIGVYVGNIGDMYIYIYRDNGKEKGRY